jgi:hypothetical protein
MLISLQGNSYGSTTTVVAKKDAQDYGWVVNNGAVYHQTQAAFNFFYRMLFFPVLSLIPR